MAFGGGLDDGDDVVSEINMTPLVDVMLVLLIIFIITVPVLTNSVRVDLPRARSAVSEAKPQTVVISITADGAVHWNEEAVDEAELEHRLHTVAAHTPQPEIQLRGDRKAAYEHVIRAMAAAQRAGIERLGFVTEPGA
jgi:biopolymer transport protein ExbD